MAQPAVLHSKAFRYRRFLNWFPMGLTYALLYMGRYNLNVAKTELGDLMTKSDYGEIFGIGAVVYAFSFLVNGPLVDRIGGKRGILIGAAGAGLMNLLMALFTFYLLGLDDPSSTPILGIFILLYALNMYFQSYGAVSIVKVNANWFHVTERGTFSGIFGVMISSGIFLAFDVPPRILQFAEGLGFSGGSAVMWVFMAPALLLFSFFFIELFILKDTPAQTGHSNFDTADASSGEDLNVKISTMDLYKRILTNPVILTVAGIEFCTGVLRNGIMHWYRIFANEQIAAGLTEGWQFMMDNWGAVLWIAGCTGGMTAGVISDKVFGSRRAPAAGLMYGILAVSTLGMIFSLHNGWILGVIGFIMSIAVIGTHGLLSGTATMDFGGRQGAATAVGVIDGFVYLGTGLQSIALGFITEWNWAYWPVFLLPFSLIGFGLLLTIWKAMPTGKKAGGH